MKYLINYNYFTESLSSEKIEWLKDALIELEDDGYNVSIRSHSVYSVSEPGITITIDGKILPINIGEYLLTIDSYLREMGFVGIDVKASFKHIRNNHEVDLSEFIEMLKRFIGKAPFDSVIVSYYKPNSISVNESIELGKSNRDDYHNLLMVLLDLFDDWNIVSYSDERFGADMIGEPGYPEHKFWAFRKSHDTEIDFMTSDVDSGDDIKDLVVYNIPVDDSDMFFDDVMSYKEQIEGLIGRRFEVIEEEVNNLFNDYIIRLI